MTEKQLGKIQNVYIGMGGYQDAQMGISFTLGGEAWGVCDFWGAWGIERSEHAKWTEADRVKTLGDVFMRINQLLKDANVKTVDQLKDIPVEVTLIDNRLSSWRVLKEVI